MSTTTAAARASARALGQLVAGVPDAPQEGPFWTNSSLAPVPQRPGETTAFPTVAGLTSAEDIAARQARADRAYAAKAQRSSLAGLTLRTAMQDIREVLLGIPKDVYSAGGRRELSLWDLVTRNDRLRGLGLLALTGALLAAALRD